MRYVLVLLRSKMGNIKNKMKKEILTMEEAREIMPVLSSFLQDCWLKNNPIPKGKFGIPGRSLDEQIIPLDEIIANSQECDLLLKSLCKGDSSSYSLNNYGPEYIHKKSFVARKLGNNLEIAYIRDSKSHDFINLVGKRDFNDQKLSQDRAVIKKFEERKYFTKVKRSIYSFNPEDIKEIIDSPELYGEVHKRGEININMKGNLSRKWEPLVLNYKKLDGECVLGFSEVNNENSIIIQYPENMSLEKTLIKGHVKPRSLDNGVKVYSENNVPKYLQRKLGL